MKIDVGMLLKVASSVHDVYHAITGKKCAFDVFTPTTEKPEWREKATPGDENLGEVKD